MPRRIQINNDLYDELLAVGPFFGVDPTTPPFYVAPQNLVSSQNIVPNVQYGGYVTVPGRVRALTEQLPSAPNGITCMQRPGLPDQYIFAVDNAGVGELWTALLDGTPSPLASPIALTPGQQTFFAPSRKWIFITNGVDVPLKISTSLVVTLWGIVAPVDPPDASTSGVGPLLGTYYYCETFSNADQESSQGAISAPIEAANNSITVTPVATTTDAQVTTRNLYRIGGSLGEWRLLHSQPVGDLTPFLDVTPESDLTGQSLIIFRDPPRVFKSIDTHQDRVFGFGDDEDPTRVSWSNYNEPWGFNPQANVLEAGPNDFNDVAVACKSIGPELMLCKTRSFYTLLGNSDNTFTTQFVTNVGCTSATGVTAAYGLGTWPSVQGIQLYTGGGAIATPPISDGQFQQSNVKSALDAIDERDLSLVTTFVWDRMFCYAFPSLNQTYVFDTRTRQWFGPLTFALGQVYYDLNSKAAPVIGSNLEAIGAVDQWFASTTQGDLGAPITAFALSRVTDNDAIKALKRYVYAYLEAVVQPGAQATLAVVVNPGPQQAYFQEAFDLGAGTPRHLWNLPAGVSGSEVQVQIFTRALEQVTVQRASVYGMIETVHQQEVTNG